MEYSFATPLLLRMPVKKPSDYSDDRQSFLDETFFRSALYLATPAFFRVLEKHEFQTGRLSEREQVTLQKYINRYCFRPTPFGLFSSVTLTEWINGPANTDAGVWMVHFQADQTFQTVLGGELLKGELMEGATYTGNPSIYRALNEYRFFRTSLDESQKQREYLLQSIAFSGMLKDLINWCGEGRTLKEISAFIMQAANCPPGEASAYAEFLTDAQLLVNCFRQNITGPGYLERLLSQPQLQRSPRSKELERVLDSLPEAGAEPGTISSLNKQLQSLVKGDQVNDQLSVVLERHLTNAGLDSRYWSSLNDGITALNALSPPDELPAMERFIQSFQQHFEGQTLPLLMALDPETGIGYQQEAPEKNNPLLETLHIPYKTGSVSLVNWTAAQRLLLRCWLRDKNGQNTIIHISEEDLQSLSEPEQELLGMSVLFRISGDHVYLENAGGINAPALMGRFTMIGEPVAKATREMTEQLENLNPNLIFAELLHLTDPHVDNVNQRRTLYVFELPVTAVSTLPAGRQLELSDLYVRIEQNKVVLFSKKHGKPVIPRLSSAYNHGLNKLPIFRFLADLPYQYGRSNLGLDLRYYFPGQPIYPRVVYKNAILCLATWVVSGAELESLQHPDPVQSVKAFKRISQQLSLPVYFFLTEGDQQLVFNQVREQEIYFFCQCVRQKDEVVLREFLPQNEVRQYNAYLLPVKPMKFPVAGTRKTAPNKRLQRKFMPGSEWLYLKIYAPRLGAARLLLRLQPLLRKRYTHGKVSKWFFIRYEDHAPHIRLRLKIAPESISEVLLNFKNKLEDRIEQHVIREYQIDMYNRELERYAAGGIEQAEDVFWASSELVLHFIDGHHYDLSGNAHLFALYSTRVILTAFISDPEQQLAFMLASYEQFLPEFAPGKVKVELDKKYRELSTGIDATLQQKDPALLSGSVKAGKRFQAILKDVSASIATENEERLSYLRSIIHMHLNRLFADEPRKQEMATYYLLYKYGLSQKGRQKR